MYQTNFTRARTRSIEGVCERGRERGGERGDFHVPYFNIQYVLLYGVLFFYFSSFYSFLMVVCCGL